MTLNLSFNEIKVISGINTCKQLRKLDLSHNFISKIQNLSELKILNVLNLSNNWISDLNDLNLLNDHNKALEDLFLKCNPISSGKNYRGEVYFRISKLNRLDGVIKSDKDKLL